MLKLDREDIEDLIISFIATFFVCLWFGLSIVLFIFGYELFESLCDFLENR